MDVRDPEWWRGAVIYQIYPRSYCDSNGDGIGDLPGITHRLDHVASLGVDAVWLSPFFKSPMKDFGYDVSDFNDIDPMFGTLADFRALLARAHQLGLKVIIDQVLSHTSDRHPWFVESRASRSNPKADWYVWADAKRDGTPPNNWLSVFGGSAWQWDTRRRQYYLHNFVVEQPDLNFHNPQMQGALLGCVRKWLDLGVDGLRLDAINFCFHDAQLRDNPGRGMPAADGPTVAAGNPYTWQVHEYDKSRPDALHFLRRLRSLADGYPGTTLLGEIGDEVGMPMVAQYTEGKDRLHQSYCFDLLVAQHDAPYLRRVIDSFERIGGSGWPCWALANHDCTRLATRWGASAPDSALLRLAAALQLSLRGSCCIYQGDELGLPEVDIAFEDLRDPYGIAMWPDVVGRDGCRTPMPWDSSAGDLGFGSGATRPWLPIGESHRVLAVDRQEADHGSLLHHYRCLLRWRKRQPALIRGDIELLAEHLQVLGYVRSLGEDRVLCAFNLSEREATFELPADLRIASTLDDSGARGAVPAGSGALRFAPYGALFASLHR